MVKLVLGIGYCVFALGTSLAVFCSLRLSAKYDRSLPPPPEENGKEALEDGADTSIG